MKKLAIVAVLIVVIVAVVGPAYQDKEIQARVGRVVGAGVQAGAKVSEYVRVHGKAPERAADVALGKPAASLAYLNRPFTIGDTNIRKITIVAIVGMRASCQPIPVLRIVAPAASMAFASCTTSSQLLPSGIRSRDLKR